MVKTAFVTCVQIGLSCIETIYEIGGQLDLLITLKDNKAKNKSGRVYLDETSDQYQVPLLKINNVNDSEVIEALKRNDIDWLFIIGWSQIAYKELLETPKKGCIGMHPTLLPEGRGRAAIPWAIIKKLDQTGVTMFKLDDGVDTGDIIAQGIIPLNDGITATELYKKVNVMHTDLIKKTWDDVVNDTLTFTKQDESLATEWPGRTPSDGEITSQMTMDEAETLVRATTNPYPGAFYIDGNKKITLWSVKKSTESTDIKLKDGYLEIVDYEIEEVADEKRSSK